MNRQGKLETRPKSFSMIKLLPYGFCLAFMFLFSCATYSDPNYDLGYQYAIEGKNEEAISYLNLSIQQNPNNSWAYFHLGYAYHQLGRYDDAIQAYSKARSLNPNDSATLNNLGLSYQGFGDYQTAAIFFKEALQLDPNNSQARTSLEIVSNNSNQQQHNNLAPEKFWNLYDKGLSLFNSGKYRESILILNDALRANPSDSDTYYLIGHNYLRLGQQKESITYFKEAVRLNPKDSSSYNMLGAVHNAMGLNNESITYYKESLNLNPNNAHTLNSLGVSYFHLGNYSSAIEYFGKAIQLTPNTAFLYFNMGEVFQKLAELEGDIEHLKKSHQFYTRSVELNKNLREAQSKLNFIAPILEEALKKSSQSTGTVGTSLGTGTGFVIGSKNHIVTNYHVVEGASIIKVKFLNGDLIEASVVSKDIPNDVAILKLSRPTTSNLTPMRLGDSSKIRLGEKIFTVGFPMSRIMGNRPKYSEGVINSTTGLQDDPRFFQISVPIQPGNSGGPLFNQEGKIIGITTSSISTLAALEKTGIILQNVNFAIKSTFINNAFSSIPHNQLESDNHNSVTKFLNSFREVIDLDSFLEKIQGNVVLIQSER